MRKILLLSTAFLLASSLSAQAATWAIDSGKSRLGFVGSQGDGRFSGTFESFKATVDFDPAHPEAGKISATIDTGSAKTGSPQRDSYLPQTDWFNVKVFPTAQFASTSIQKVGDHNFVAQGTLTIKGVTLPVSLPFTLVEEGDHWRAQGKLTLIRTDYRVGEGDWSNEDYVKKPVEVDVDLVAKPQP